KNIMITGNIIRDASREENTAYDIIRIEGYNSDIKAESILINDNFIIRAGGNMPRYAISLKNVKNSMIKNNSFLGGYSGSNPVETEDVDNIKVSGNVPFESITVL